MMVVTFVGPNLFEAWNQLSFTRNLENMCHLALSTISHAGMKEYLHGILARLRYIFNKADLKAKWALIISSYKTHKIRTGEKKQKKTPSIAYKKKRYNDNGNMI
jgi:hypothetical protein